MYTTLIRISQEQAGSASRATGAGALGVLAGLANERDSSRLGADEIDGGSGGSVPVTP